MKRMRGVGMNRASGMSMSSLGQICVITTAVLENGQEGVTVCRTPSEEPVASDSPRLIQPPHNPAGWICERVRESSVEGRQRGGWAAPHALSVCLAERGAVDQNSRKFLRILAVNTKRRDWLATAPCVNLGANRVLTGWLH